TVRGQQTHRQADRGALAGTVGPDQAHDLARLQVQVQVVQAEVAEGLAHPAHVDRLAGAHRRFTGWRRVPRRASRSSGPSPSWLASATAWRRCSSSFWYCSSLAALPRPLSATNEPLPWRVTITPSCSSSR